MLEEKPLNVDAAEIKQKVEDKAWEEFYGEVYSRNSDYYVFMTRRAFVLNEIYIKKKYKKGSEEFQEKEKKFLSCNAFLTKAKRIAEEFCNNKKFPSILICDEIMMHGRGVEKFLHEFERLLMNYTIESANKRMIQMKLYQSIEIWIFACNKYKLLLEPAYQTKLHVKEYKSEFEIRQLSEKFSELIIDNQEANISYVMSLYIDKTEKEKLNNSKGNWALINWKYKNWTLKNSEYGDSSDKNNEEIFFRENVFINDNAGFLQTVRFINDGTNQPLIALSIVDDDIINNVDLLYEKLIELYRERFGENNIEEITKIFELKDDILKKIRVQLINFNLSLFSMRNFIREYDINYKESDINNKLFLKKISSNFDFRGILESGFQKLINFFLNQEDTEFDSKFEKIFTSNKSYKISDGQLEASQMKKISERIEDVVCELGLEAEWEATCVEKGERWFEPLKIGFGKIGFFECFDRINSLCNEDRIELNYYIAGVLSIMDKGLISMNIEMENGQAITSLSAGERASLIWSERFENFIPALAAIEQEQWKFKMDMVKTMEKFVNELEYCLNDDKEILLSLRSNIKTFTKMIGLSGSSFQNLFYYYKNKWLSMNEDVANSKRGYYYEKAVEFSEKNAVF